MMRQPKLVTGPEGHDFGGLSNYEWSAQEISNGCFMYGMDIGNLENAELLAVSGQPDRENFEVIQCAADSGAVDNVGPGSVARAFKTEANEASKNGWSYITANGGRVPNRGEKRVAGKTVTPQSR